MKLNTRRFCAALGIAVFTMTALGDNSFVVTTASDSGAGSLRQAILNANAASGGTITFSNVTGQITLAGQVAVSAVGDGTFCVQMLAPAGYSYTVQRAATLLGPWTSFATASPDANGHASCIDASPSAGSGFYRIFCQPH